MYELITKLRQPIKISAYFLVPLFLAIFSSFWNNPAYYRVWGQIAIWLVIGNLYIKPLSVLLPNRYFAWLLSQRRQFGVAAVWFFLFHSGSMIWTGKLWLYPEFFAYPSLLFFGLLAGIGMLILGATSNSWATRTFKKNWKKIHWVAYPTLLLGLTHAGLVSGKSIYGIVGMLYVVLKIAQLLKTHRNKAKLTMDKPI